MSHLIMSSNHCGSVLVSQLVLFLSIFIMAPKAKTQKALTTTESSLIVLLFVIILFFNILYILDISFFLFYIKILYYFFTEVNYQRKLPRVTRICTTSFPTT